MGKNIRFKIQDSILFHFDVNTITNDNQCYTRDYDAILEKFAQAATLHGDYKIKEATV